MQNRHTYLWTTVLCLALCSWLLFELLTPATDMVRFRNSLLASVGTADDFRWSPDRVPTGFRIETSPAPGEIRQAADQIRQETRDKNPMIGIVEHLRQKPKRKGPIKSTTVEAYREITQNGRGYCADYTQVFNGLAHALQIPVREWGMSFDNFSGDGHAFNEVWDDALSQWVFVDSFHGFYVRDKSTDRPLSALGFRERLVSAGGFESVAIVPIGQTFRFDSPTDAFDYYIRGANQFYLWFGNHVFAYDNDRTVQVLSRLSRAIEQLGAIVTGVHPEIRVYPTESNSVAFEYLDRLRVRVLVLSALFAVLSAVLVLQLFRLRRGDARMR